MEINGTRLEELVTCSIDFTTGRIRGTANSVSDALQLEMRGYPRSARMRVKLVSPERTEFEGEMKLLMFRVRLRYDEVIRIWFVFEAI